MLNPLGILTFILVVALPAYYINKWLLQWVQPRKSLLRFGVHVLLCMAAGVLYTTLFILLMRLVN
jgi:hypothetical protein